VPIVMENESIKEEDNWWRFKKQVELFAKKNKELYYASSILVFDESMSASIPRTKKTGELTNILYVKRNLEPLGTEVKNVVDGISGSMLWIEIQEGKERMKNKEYQNLGSTTACILRGVMVTKYFDSYSVSNINVDEKNDENNSPPHSNPQDPQRIWCGNS